MTTASIIPFIHDLTFDDLPADVIQQAQRCLLDLIGTAAGGSMTDTARIICNHALRQFAAGTGRGARMLFDGRSVSAPGAALAGGMMIDSLDCHDGHVLTKGHVGVAVLPALLALIESGDDAPDGSRFLTDIVLGYEFATRAGIALHSTVCDYHSSGAWNALACAALGARYLRLSSNQTRQALGIAEYHGPRSQIMRVVDYPTMVKDGSGWGAMAGLSAAWLAADGFSGAPALTVEHADVALVWEDLGTRWRIREQYFKAYPVCRWAQPAIEAALSLQRRHQIQSADIARIEVFTFHEGTRLATRRPLTTDEAQYSLPFPVAAALVRGQVAAAEVMGDSLNNADIQQLADAICLIEDSGYNARFPAERWAHVTFQLHDGRHYTSEPAIARGNPENPLSDAELLAKYRLLAEPVLGPERTQAIANGLNNLPAGDLAAFLDLLLSPATASGE